jgi:hypothetical protein
MEELERVVALHSWARRLTNAELRDQVNVAFEARDHLRSWAIYLEIQTCLRQPGPVKP